MKLKQTCIAMKIAELRWLWESCNKTEMNQGGLKHAATESRLDSKRERRRGASGRAAALRRAPSDSDCSGETASLSADSGDRAVRPPPPPTRVTKSRSSRRRGSEWEVLEGLKDGQRFEKRPDVFNGYLHKKRKWPLKGWHKRFFVVDGGILVYARSPTDVARGRLHGSVDVGLSVISAKARRRRIDIDADEFIYHLRAKTADVFRTWLNVLKAHRLYRQHLLTFGARESVPKIHAPLDDLPPTDTSSRTSQMSTETGFVSNEDFHDSVQNLSFRKSNDIEFNSPKLKVKSPDLDWHFLNKEEKYVFFNFPNPNNGVVTLNNIMNKRNRSLCSMNCVARFNRDRLHQNSPQDLSQVSTNNEQQVHITDLESIHSNISKSNKTVLDIKNCEITDSRNLDKNPEPACYFFSHKKRKSAQVELGESLLKNSRKSTNLVKYRNVLIEPRLKRPISKCLLLKNYRFSKSESRKYSFKDIGCDPIPKEYNDVEATVSNFNKVHKSVQNLLSATDYDKITERIMVSIFEKHKIVNNAKDKEVKYYVKQIVRELYDVKFSETDIHPVKVLFRSLLEYWLTNTSEQPFQEAIRRVISVGKPSNNYFTRDKMLSSYVLTKATKQTQFHGISDFMNSIIESRDAKRLKSLGKNRNSKKPVIRCHSPKRDTESFEKERRIQELERILKNTVYVCETVRSDQNKEKDIIITKKLLDNLENKSNRSILDNIKENSNSSTELPKIQETINHLINDTEIPPDVAKEFFGAYLGILLDSSKSVTSTSQSSEQFDKSHEPTCDVIAESVQKKISKSVVTSNLESINTISFTCGDHSVKQKVEKDSGELYLKEMLDKITNIFTKTSKDKKQDVDNNDKLKRVKKNETEEILIKHVSEFTNKNLIHENVKDNSLVIDLSKYDLEHISMSSEPKLKDVMSITIKLKEKPSHFGESKTQQVNLKFCNNTQKSKCSDSQDDFIKILGSKSSKKISDPVDMNLNATYDIGTIANIIDLKRYTSTSDVTSKAYCKIIHESEHSIDLSFNSSNYFRKEQSDDNEDLQSCYIVSSFKKNSLTTKLQSKKKVRLRSSHELSIDTESQAKSSKQSSSNRYPVEYSVFEQRTPRIIDEKFILLLLENLTMLSKNIPSLYKDLNALYIKLKKKHDKVIRNCNNIQGLSLLGKIYNDDDKPNNRETQYEKTDCKLSSDVQLIRNYKDTEMNTLLVHKDIVACSKSVNTFNIPYDTKFTDVQTEFSGLEFAIPALNNRLRPLKISSSQMTFSSKEFSYVDHSLSSTKFGKAREIKDEGTSVQNWNVRPPSKECAISTVIKTVLDNPDNMKIYRLTRPKNFENVHVLKADKDFLSMNNNKSNHQKRVISPPRTSIESQTEKRVKIVKHSKLNYHFVNDHNVYQLALSQMRIRKSSSATNSIALSNNMSDDLKTLYRCPSEPSYCSGLVSPTSATQRGLQACFVSGTPGGRLAGWIIESGGPLENASRELGQAQLSVQQLQRLLEALELQHQVHHDTDVSLEGASPNVKKDRRKFGLRKKKSNSKCASVELAPPHIDPSSSHMALSALTAPPSPGGGASSVPNSAASLPIACAAARPQSLPGAESLGGAAGPASLTSLTPDHQLREDFTVLAKDLVANLKSIVSTLVIERGRLRAAVEATESSSPGALLAALRTNLNSALHQNNVYNTELRSRLSRIHDASDLAEISSMGANSDPQQGNRQFQQSLSYSSSCVSASEFFDAEEHDEDLKPAEIIAADEAGVIELDGDSSSEGGSLSSEEGSASSENSDGAMLSAEQVSLRLNQNGIEPRPVSCWTRRTCLPSPRPTPGGPSLWNLLYKNIGKDLSQISMPVTINEPLNMLQRLCEELEYSELLDAASECKNAVERMALIAAFAVSAYASSAHRAASKPFNPLLAETYECVRDDKGFRFIAEQVSHHPPISACHAESSRWCFWQEARIKTKFWGKSMEFQPAGRVHVRLTTTGDHYSWNKVTTCVHNLFGGQRWVDQYGDMHIMCHGTDITCKLNFIKASSWSSSRHEVRGMVTGPSRLRLQGRWSEALYAGEPPAARCMWRPGAMPPEHELYYGFTRFAMELNEMEPGMQKMLPHTDTRLRPDQRALELGDVDAAEQYKHELEQAQRERRRDCPEHTPAWFCKRVESGEETWVFTGEYWKARETNFPGHSAPRIW
ncbi:unnamed protein product [Chilo suppressalis]|uniref:Oxysterol-binding protein n=1 Tax=Chilo suppressalis TaxID=168631 RepID=A0ABN8B972_CHISP|nr:unnamed protein product [Chilo suppressalis]